MKRQTYEVGNTRYIRLTAETLEEGDIIRDLILVVPWRECRARGDRVAIITAFFGSIDFRTVRRRHE